MTSKFEKHYVSRLLRLPYSPDTSPCDFWLFGMLKGVLKDREFNSSDEIQEAIMKEWDELIFDEVQSVFHNWMSRLAWVIENGGEYIIESIPNDFLACPESQNRMGRELSFHPVAMICLQVELISPCDQDSTGANSTMNLCF
jgi:hypothetical protein